MTEPAVVREWNWARTHWFRASVMKRPETIAELQSLVVQAQASKNTVRCVGSRHSFTDIADGTVMLDLSRLPERFAIAPDRASVLVNGAMSYARLAKLLRPHRLAVHNLASLPHITIAGATATGTHGSGDRNRNLATSIRSVELISASGDMQTIHRDDRDFALAALGLGALGVVTALELDLVPHFDVRQLVHGSLSWRALETSFDALFGSAYSVSVFTNWVDHVQLWTKERIGDDVVDHSELHDGVLATTGQHPVPGVSAESCTPQGPEPGPWDERLPHFRAGGVPSIGAEVQSEFFVDRQHATAAIAALRSIGSKMAPHLMAAEIRTIAADHLWLSPQYQRDCVGFHFTWHHDVQAAMAMSQLVASTLGPFGPLPHWGKCFDASQFDFGALYPRLGDAHRAFARHDPTGAFRNDWFNRTFHNTFP